MLPTPSTSHVDYSRIYEPAEDSFLMLDTLSSQSETAFLQSRFAINTPAPLVVEVGIGSGVVIAFVTAHAQQIFGDADVATLGIDVNPFACVASQQTIRNAANLCRAAGGTPGAFLDCLNGDLLTAVKSKSIDVLIFNPPYVPSEEVPRAPATAASQGPQSTADRFTRDSHLLSLSTDGGLDGMEITNRLLDELDSILSARGVAYILLCAQNKPDRVIASVQSWPNTYQETYQSQWRAEKVSSSGSKAGWERLCVVRIWREAVDA